MPLLLTPDVQRGLDMFRPWLTTHNKHSFLAVRPVRCGRVFQIRAAALRASFLYSLQFPDCYTRHLEVSTPPILDVFIGHGILRRAVEQVQQEFAV